MSILVHQHLSIDELSIVLICLGEVNITDAKEVHAALKQRLTRTLRKAAPDHYQDLVNLGKIDAIEAR